MSGPGVVLTPAQLLEHLPQQAPFRFVDEILSVETLRLGLRSDTAEVSLPITAEPVR